jgi:hypothetical protein
MSEVVDVARAKGLQVPEGTIDKLIEQVRFQCYDGWRKRLCG